MSKPAASVVIPSRDRARKLGETLISLRRQTVGPLDYELIVVDDGSTPPLMLPPEPGPPCHLVRLQGHGRSEARNAGAERARGGLLVFVDDDMGVGHDFVAAHLRAHQEWPGALIVGAIRLPLEAGKLPFGRFRQCLEDLALPDCPGLTSRTNFCAAGNMSIPWRTFQELGGFLPDLASGEDQDLALRHSARGGRIVFWPEAFAVHRDDALDIRSYCRRAEWGSEELVPFCQRHPNWPDNRNRLTVNGPLCWGEESMGASARKVAKAILGLKPLQEALFFVIAVFEKAGMPDHLLERLYRLMLGIHLRRGYQRGLRRYGTQAVVAESGIRPDDSRSRG